MSGTRPQGDGTTPQPADLPELTRAVLAVLLERGHRLLPDPVELSSGHRSSHFIDAKRALARGSDLARACRALLALAAEAGVSFDAVGGLTLGADHLAHGVALLSDTEWFTVRKRRKGRGTAQRIEGARLVAGHRVLLVEDVVTTGGSIREALEAVAATGAEVVLATTLVDRGELAAPLFAGEAIPYRPLLTYRDLNIEPVT